MSRYFLLAVFSVLCTTVQGQAPVLPAIEWDKRFGGDTVDVMQLIRAVSDDRYLLAGYSYSSATGNKSDASQGGADYWLTLIDSSGKTVFVDTSYGGTGNDMLTALEKTNDGGYIAGGYSNSWSGGHKADTSRGGYDFWILKLNSSFQIQWQKTFGCRKDEFLTSIIQTTDGGYLVGGYSDSDTSNTEKTDTLVRGGYDYWVIKLDASGNRQWDKTLGGAGDDILTAAMQTPDGSYLLGGYSNSGILYEKKAGSKGNYDFWVVKLSPADTVIWDQTYGGSSVDKLFAMKRGKYGDYMLCGESNSAAGGNKTASSKGNYDFWVVAINDTTSAIKWDKTYGGTKDDQLRCVYIIPEGDMFFGGFSLSDSTAGKSQKSKGGFDYWIVKTDSVGGYLWDYSVGGPSNDYLYSIDHICDRGFILGGTSESGIGQDKTEASQGYKDYWAVRLKVTTKALFYSGTVCKGEVTSFLDKTETYPDKWSWDFGEPSSDEANYSNEPAPKHQYRNSGTFWAKLIVSEGCQTPDTLMLPVIVKYNPVYGLADLGPDQEICEGEVITLTAGEGFPVNTTYEWSTGDSTYSISVKREGLFWVRASNAGCTTVDQAEIADCPFVYVPNAFTPDGDGNNELFYTYGNGIHYYDFSFRIYDRWGALLFEADDQSKGWDGTYNGNPVQEDAYIWIVSYKGIEGEPRTKTGYVVLVR